MDIKHQNINQQNKKDSLKLVRQIVSSLKFLNTPSAKQYAILQEITSSSDVTNEDINEILTKYKSNLKVASLNVGYNVMANKTIGSEAPKVALCQKIGNKGWHNNQHTLASCSYNSAIFLSDYKLFGLQEVNRNFQKPFQDAIIQAGKQKIEGKIREGRDYQFISSYYFGDFGIVIGYDRNEMGNGIQITPDNYLFGDPNSSDIRGMQAVFFPVRNLLMINLHAPHYIDLVYHLNANFANIAKLFLQSEVGKVTNIKETRIIITGDFNDFKGLLIEPSIQGQLTIFGKVLKMHINGLEDVPISCCTDTHYKYVGDYIFDSAFGSNQQTEQKDYYYGLPLGYDRRINLLSDHDPVVLIELDSLKGKSFNGVIVMAGTYVEIRLNGLDQDMLLDIAQVYLKRNGIDWNVHKPLAWTKYHGGPHVTLSPAMAKYQGQESQVKLGDLYTYVSGDARWVMISAELPSKLKCQYECHMSIGEQRIK